MRRHYSDADRATALAALAANGGRLSLTAHETGIPRETLRRWRDAPDVAAPPDLRQEKAEEVDMLLERWARAALRYGLEWLEGKHDAHDPRIVVQVMTGVGIALDKMQLLRNRPTAINEWRQLVATEGLSAAEVLAEAERILADGD